MPPASSAFRQIALVALGATALMCWSPWTDRAMAESDAINLQPQFEPGRTSRYSLYTQRDSRMEVSFNGRDQSFERGTLVEGEATWTVERVHADGSARCVLVIDWLAVTVTSPDGDRISSDSRRGGGDNPGLDEVVNALARTPLSYDISPAAVIRRVEGLRDIQRQLRDLPEDAFSEADLMEMAYDLAIVGSAPAEARPGAAWRHELERSHELGTFHVRMDYELVGSEWIEGQAVASLQGHGRLRFEPRKSDGPAQVDVALRDPSCEEQIMWDLDRHEVVGRHESRAYTLAMTIRFGDQGSIRQTLTESVLGQVLRIAEE
jgi:hypothetical protein